MKPLINKPLLICAPSGAGKSTWLRKLDRSSYIAQDGDDIPGVKAVYRMCFETWGAKWWENPAHADFKVEGMLTAFNAFLSAKEREQGETPMRRLIVASAELTLLQTDVASRATLIVVVPSLEEMLQHFKKRQADPNQKSHFCTLDPDKIRKQLTLYTKVAAKDHARVVPNFSGLETEYR